MMDLVLVDGDTAIFQPTFGLATVVVQPGTLAGSGKAQTVASGPMAKAKPVCVEGDEASVSVTGCSYVTAQCSVAGSGTLEVSALADDQTATLTQSGGKKVLLVGSRFTARFKVQTPAKQPAPASTPDTALEYIGTGSFVTTNSKFRAT